ncbi:ankyrin repeat domain-containing protein 33B-like isoform 3 [Dinothrombium tinctorium]|uniref:Ankyrin repeat domain-containing protein 33B-like isoform 3 n=1 Tax=Dinothrombium tinctorium TaxID=1965070 RepID=A0A3S3PBT1_9ACAR|nr:ankyrin repeat domain-containing protein 33B-like isoform 3 [Dinothrombium tinctorium]
MTFTLTCWQQSLDLVMNKLSSIMVNSDEYCMVPTEEIRKKTNILNELWSDEPPTISFFRRNKYKKLSMLKEKSNETNDVQKLEDFHDLCKKRDEYKMLHFLKQRTPAEQEVNYKDTNGLTGFSYLCQNGDLAMLRKIAHIKHIDVNVQDNEGNTPLILASQAGTIIIEENFLLKLNKTNAQSLGHSQTVAFLIDHFRNALDIDKRNNFGFTALIKASLLGRVKCVKILLAAGANIVLRDPNKGYNALEWAQYCGRTECVNAIKYQVKHCDDPIYKHFKKYAKSIDDVQSWLKDSLTLNSISYNSKTKQPFGTILRAISSSTALCAAFTVTPAIENTTDESENVQSSVSSQSTIPQIEVTKLESNNEIEECVQ